MIRRPPRSPLFPSTTLFRSLDRPEIVDPVLDDLDRLLNRLPRALDHRGLGHREADRAAPDVGGGTIRLTVTEAAMIERTRSEEHTSELQSRLHLVCRLLLEK